MGFGDKVKDVYFSAEEKWYGMLDKIDAHVPIYKVVDKVDQVVPSFALFIIIIIILLLLIGIGIFGLAGGVGGEATLQLTVIDNSGSGVSGAEITLEGTDETYYSNEYGHVEDITLLAGTTINVTATKGDKTKSKQILLDENPKVEEIKLPVDQVVFESMTALFMTETGQRINDRLELNYHCTSGTGTPANDIIYDGSANINVSSTCGTLTVTITSEKYETATKTITQPASTFYLIEKIPAKMVTMSVQLKSGGNLITEGVTVKAFRMNNLYLPEDTVVSSNGSATFTLQEGNYKFSTVTEQGYLTNSISNVAITTGMQPVVIDLTKSVIGKIKVTAKRGSIQLDEVFITLLKNSSEVHTGDTNEDGEIEFEVAETGPYVVIATKKGYCSETKAGVSIGDDVQIAMKTDTGTCGGTLLVKVLDQDNKPVQYARTIIFGEKEDDSYKLGYDDKLTDYNGEAQWKPVKYSEANESYRVFAFKGSYTGWSTLREFNALNQSDAFTIKLNIPLGTVNVIVKDKDGDPITFSDQEPVYVRLYEDFGNTPVSGKKIIEDSSGLISFVTKAGRRVYAVVEKEGYQSHMTLPREVIGDGTVTFDVVLSRPPIDELYVNSLGLYKNGSKVLKVEAGQEYDALFELIAPKDYEELGFFVRVGRDDYTKTELDKIYIKEMIAPGAKDILKGATYNPPKGYATDSKYLNQDESKWGEVIWGRNDFVQGRIMISAKVKIRDNAQTEEQLNINYRAWGVLDGSYERDLPDDVLGTSASNSTKQELYAATKEDYTTVGMETLCEESGERAFCITSNYTDPQGITTSFDTTFDAKNNSEYNLFIKVMNASNVSFDLAKVKLENDEENLRLGTYSLYTPTNQLKTGTINDNSSEWIETNNYAKNSSITFNELKVTPTSTGYGSLKLRIVGGNTILFEKVFGINVSSNKKMRADYMYNSTFQEEVPKIASGKVQTLTIRAKNNANGLEIDNAMIKLYDRFGTKLTEKTTNSLGTTTITIPASLPGEKLTIKIEKPDYETFVQDFTISEEIVDVDPTTLGFTVNPQTKPEETKTIKIENKTGFDLKIKEIVLTGKFKGKLNESQIESWLYNYSGTTIASDDYEEIDLKIISASSVKSADDLTGVFQITLTNGYTEWVKEIDATIRVGLGKDSDDPNCLAITQNDWSDATQGEQISIGFEIINNCTVDGTPIPLTNLAARDEGSGNILGTFSVQSDAAYSEVVRGFARTFQPSVDESEVVPVTLSFVPKGGVNGQTSGSIIFQATNKTDSKDQVIQTSIAYAIDAINLDACITVGSDLIHITEGESGSFSVTNNCPTDVYFEIETELMTSDDKFTLTTGETKEVSLTGEEDVVGAFNTLIYGREGSSTMELIDNVKTIIDPEGGCFSLSRYEFDIYDAPDDDYDGEDTAILKNSCTEKNVTTTVEGVEEYDYDNLMQAAVLGALAGFVGSDFTLYGSDKNRDIRVGKAGTPLINGNNYSGDPIRMPENSSRANTNAEKESIKRLVDGSSRLIDEDELEVRTPAVTLKEYKKVRDQTVNALKAQKEKVYQDKGVTKSVLNGFRKAAGVVGSALGATGKFFKGLVFGEEITTGSAEDKAAILNAEAYIVTKIDESISKINDEYGKMKKEYATYQKAITTATRKGNDRSRAKAAELSSRIKTIGMSKEEVNTEVTRTLAEEKEKLKTAYTEGATEFNTKYRQSLEKIKRYLVENKKDLEMFSIKINEELEVLQAANEETKKDVNDEMGAYNTYTTANLKEKQKLLNDGYTTQIQEYKNELSDTKNVLKNIQKTISKNEKALAECNKQITELTAQKAPSTETQKFKTLAESLETTNPVLKERAKKLEEDIPKYESEIEQLKKGQADTKINFDNAIATQTPLEIKTEYTKGMKIIIKQEITKNEALQERLGELIDSEADVDADAVIDAEVAVSAPEEAAAVPKEETAEDAPAPPTEDSAKPDQTAESETQITHTMEVLANGTSAVKVGDIRVEKTSDTISELSHVYRKFGTGDTALYVPINYIDKILTHTQFISEFDKQEKVTEANLNKPKITSVFLMSTSASGRRGSESAHGQTSTSGSSGILNDYTSQIMGTVAAWNSGSALSGALMAALFELMQASDTLVDEGYTFIVDFVTVDSVTLESAEGISMDVGESTYDYDDFYTGASGGDGYNISSESLATNYNLVEEKKLTFRNPGAVTSDTPYQPLVGILKVTAGENVYNDEYNYEDIRKAAIERGDYEENDAEWYEFWDVSTTEIADMEEEDLVVEETRTIEKEFHLLFNSYEYTTTIDPPVIGNCTVGAKTGSTGPEAVPKILFDWDWSNIDIDTCDESNSDYVYCDTTQFTTTILKKLNKMKEFFRTSDLSECPQAIDTASTKTKTLSETDLDVGITQIQASETTGGAQLELVVSTNNNLPMDIALNVKVYQTGTTNLKAECNETKNVTSTATYYCSVDTSTSGSGVFDVVSTITPTLCTGCENNDSTNDIMNSQLIIGQTGVQDCLYYKTQKDYFVDVLAANGLLSSSKGQEMLGYLNFTANLVRDGFSKDFKEDFDDYMNTFTVKPTTYTDLEGLFESSKFSLGPSGENGSWDAGKYNVQIVVEFEEDNWKWNDDNDIKSIEIILSDWESPRPKHAIYDIGFNGLVGLFSDDGRIGYGAGYNQIGDDALTIVPGIEATHSPASNALTEVNVDVDKDFYTMNTSRRGNVLTISRAGSKVNLVLSPNIAVPLLLDVTRTSARDAYAFYTVEVDSQPQTTGSSFITWNGIGNGCVDFDGKGMGSWDNAPDSRESGGNGYGFGGSVWTNAKFQGTVSLYGTFYVPDGSSTAIFFTRQSEDALFTSTQGTGDLLTIDTSSGISTLKDVFTKVANEEICVIGGEYFWNSGKVYEPIEADIISRANTCIQSV